MKLQGGFGKVREGDRLLVLVLGKGHRREIYR